MQAKRIRYYIFLRDVLILSVSAFGGPQAHLAMLFDMMVHKRGYLSEEELIELHALCQILPGPTSTQTITALGFKIGGPNLAYLTLLIWMLPAVTIMITAAIIIANLQARNISIDFTKYIQPMAVGFVTFAAYKISAKVVHTRTAMGLMIIAAVVSYFVKNPLMFPLILLISGAVTALKFKAHPKEQDKKLQIDWRNFILWATVLGFVALLGGITGNRSVLLFENFYRNGSLIFGGGQVLIPLLYTEFVEFKSFLTSEEFLSGFGIVQALPGPVFSFSAFIGTLAMRDLGIFWQIVGGLIAAAGIFLPGTFLIFFVIRFWEQLKKYRVVKASLEGINAASSGLVIAAAFLLFQPIEQNANVANISILVGTFIILMFTRIPAPFIIIGGLIAGFIF
ncbi:MAG: chromate efflux transporter [Cyclobacteriaceae bacterium]|nr:chromate efflux transporter [Cyclobacteriaceae bacterium]